MTTATDRDVGESCTEGAFSYLEGREGGSHLPLFKTWVLSETGLQVASAGGVV